MIKKTFAVLLFSLVVLYPSFWAFSVPTSSDDAAGISRSCSVGFNSNPTAGPLQPPANLEQVAIEHPQVLLALRDKTSGFPTFNVLFQGGAAPLGESETAATIRTSYKMFGLDIASIESSPSMDPGSYHLVSYKLGGEELLAIVGFRGCGEGHVVLTLVTQARAREAGLATWREILAQLQVTPASSPDQNKSQTSQSSSILALLGALIAGLVVVLAAVMLNQRYRTGKI